MIVQDLIQQVPVEDFLEEYRKLEDVDKNMIDPFSFFTGYFKKLSEPYLLATEHIILGCPMYDPDEDKEMFDTSAFLRDEVDAFKPMSRHWYKDRESFLSSGRYWQKLTMREFPLPVGYAYEINPWKKIIGMMVDEGNVEDCTPAKLLAYIVYELSFLAYDLDEQEDAVARFNAKYAADEKILSELSEEELAEREKEGVGLLASVLESRQESKEEEEEEAEDEEEEEENEEEEAAQREKEAARLREKYDRAEALNYVYRYEMFVRYYNRNKA